MRYQIFLGDCLESLKEIPPCDLIYMDPPFGPVGEDVYYGVGETFEDYLEYMLDRIKHVCSGQKDFNFILHVDPKASHYLKVEVDKVLGRKTFRTRLSGLGLPPRTPRGIYQESTEFSYGGA